MKRLALHGTYLLAIALACAFGFVVGQWRDAYVHSGVALPSALITETTLDQSKLDSARSDNAIRAQAAYRMINSLPRWVSHQPGTRPVPTALQLQRATVLHETLSRAGQDVPMEQLNSFVAQHLSKSDLFSVTVR